MASCHEVRCKAASCKHHSQGLGVIDVARFAASFVSRGYDIAAASSEKIMI